LIELIIISISFLRFEYSHHCVEELNYAATGYHVKETGGDVSFNITDGQCLTVSNSLAILFGLPKFVKLVCIHSNGIFVLWVSVIFAGLVNIEPISVWKLDAFDFTNSFPI